MRIILDIPISLGEVIRITGGVCNTACTERQIIAITTDSRECEDGDLFFSLASSSEKRIKHATEAEQCGAYTVCDGCGFITVENTELALLRLGAGYKKLLPRLAHTVAITGSVGKSTATRYTASLLSLSHRVCSTVGNFNNRIGISLSVLCARRDTEMLVLEMGMNHRGEIAEMAELIQPDLCVITNVGNAHIGNLGSREAISLAKREIITDRATGVIVPCDEPLLKDVRHRLGASLDGTGDFSLFKSGEDYSFKAGKKVIDGIIPAISGGHNLYNLLIAGAVAAFLGASLSDIKRGLNSLSDSLSGTEITDCGVFTLIDDSYNSSPEAAEAMLAYLAKFPRPHSALLADMLELGDMAGELHYSVGKRAAGLDRLYVTGKYAEYVALGAIDAGMSAEAVRVIRECGKEELARLLTEEAAGGTLLVKGSHSTGLYEVTKILRRGTGRN